MERSPKSRAASANEALEQYARDNGNDMASDQERLIDLLADLMHFAKRQSADEDCPVSFDDALASARMHFEAED